MEKRKIWNIESTLPAGKRQAWLLLVYNYFVEVPSHKIKLINLNYFNISLATLFPKTVSQYQKSRIQLNNTRKVDYVFLRKPYSEEFHYTVSLFCQGLAQIMNESETKTIGLNKGSHWPLVTPEQYSPGHQPKTPEELTQPIGSIVDMSTKQFTFDIVLCMVLNIFNPFYCSLHFLCFPPLVALKFETYTAFTPSKSRHRVHFVILMMTKD